MNVRGIIEFSNYCKRSCKYCGLNIYNKTLPRYRMTQDEILETSIEAESAGYKTIVLQSGEDSHFTTDILCDIISKIKAHTSIAITLSSGEMKEDDYRKIKQSGCDRYLLKHETADESIYSDLHPDYSLKSRVECLKILKKLGYETGGGFMIGLPNQTMATIADDLLLLQSIPCDMAGVGPFIPHPETPLKDCPKGDPFLTKKAVAILRLLLPESNLPATTSLSVIDSAERDSIFSCGANVIMKKLTPPKYRAMYEIYPVAYAKFNTIAQDRKILNDLLLKLNKTYD